MSITQTFQLACGLACGLATTSVLAQVSDPTPPSIETPTAVETAEAAEDLPPPEPMPAPQTASPVRRVVTGRDGLVRAHDFGVSLLPAETDGVPVRGVIVGSAAERAGVKPRDTIIAINGQAVTDAAEVAQAQVQSVTISRRGEQQTLAVQSGQSNPTAYPVTPSAAYSVPRTTYSAPPRYMYSRTPGYAYPAAQRRVDYGYGNYYGYNSYPRRPNVTIGFSIGSSRGYPGYYGRGYGRSSYYGRPSFYGPGFYGGRRSGVGIRIGGIGISF